jgi:hypothetical protein
MLRGNKAKWRIGDAVHGRETNDRFLYFAPKIHFYSAQHSTANTAKPAAFHGLDLRSGANVCSNQ